MNDKHYLLTDNLCFSSKDYNIKKILDDSINQEWCKRNFNNEYLWSRERASYYIESVLLRYHIQKILIYSNNNNIKVIDGLQRLVTLIKFFNDELQLSENGLHRLKFLKNQRFSNLPNEYKKILLDDCKLKIGIYTIRRPELNLSIDDQEYIQKQLYIRYNTGIQLKNYQLQKAQYCNDYISKYFINYLKNNDEWKDTLKNLKIFNDKNKKNDIDYCMVKIREFIGLTYSSLPIYINYKSSDKVNKGYENYINKDDFQYVIDNFIKSINRLYKLYKKIDIEKYKNFSNFNFINSVYWLISIIIKDNLMNIEEFNDEKFIEYCIRHDDNNYFAQNPAHKNKNKIARFKFVATFLEKMYSIDMEQYFVKNKKDIKNDYHFENVKNLPLFDELKGLQYNIITEDTDISQILDMMKEKSFIIRPAYQRNEEKNLRASSGIIESLIMGVTIPNILIYKYIKDKKVIYEVVDGQQRLLSFIGFMGKEYLDENETFQKSEKNNFALEKLKIFTDYNGKSFNGPKKKELSDGIKSRIMRANIQLSIISQELNLNFEPIDHYIRLNININNLQMNSYKMWNVACDKFIMDKINETSALHKGNIFPNSSYEKAQETIITNCGYNEFQNSKQSLKNNGYFRKWRNVSSKEISIWLEAINDKNRINYFNCIDEVNSKLFKIEKWINFIESDIYALFHLKKYSKISNKKYYILYYLLSDLPENILLEKADTIHLIIIKFYENLKKINDKLIELDENNLIKETKVKLKILYITTIEVKV